MYVYIDLETIAGTDVPEDLLKIDSRLKDPAKIEAARQEALAKTSFDGAFGEIASIAWAVNDGEIGCAVRGDESEFRTLCRALGGIDEAVKTARAEAAAEDYAIKWVGHNIAFDLGFLFKRCAVHGVSLSPYFPWPVNPWDRAVHDTQYMWAGRDFVKLDTLAYVLLAERKTNSGADVAGMWERGEYDKIADYNRDDVRITREVHKRLLGVRDGN